ncbi:MAG: hypothetical protein AAF125_27220, partial [Chloroflexota bacterium]
KAVYDAVVSHDPYGLGTYPASAMLAVSRMATFAPSLETFSKESLMRMWRQYSSQSLRTFCVSLGMDLNAVTEIADLYDLHSDEVIDHPWNDDRFMGFLNNPSFKKYAKETVEDQRAALAAYLDGVGAFSGENGASVIVDIGWRGTIQDNLAQMTSRHVHGLYLGLLNFLNPQPTNTSKVGWLFDMGRDVKLSFGSDVAPIELMFNALGGSVVGYERDGDASTPKTTVIDSEETVIERLSVPLQAAMMDALPTVVDYVRLHGLTSSHIHELAYQALENVLTRPPAFLADAFFALDHNEMFGTGTVEDVGAHNVDEDALDSLDGGKLYNVLVNALEQTRWTAGFARQQSLQGLIVSRSGDVPSKM